MTKPKYLSNYFGDAPHFRRAMSDLFHLEDAGIGSISKEHASAIFLVFLEPVGLHQDPNIFDYCLSILLSVFKPFLWSAWTQTMSSVQRYIHV